MTTIDHDQDLRALDAAPTDLDRTLQAQLLERIVASDRLGVDAGADHLAPRRVRRGQATRWVLVPVAAAVGIFVAQSVGGGGGPAYASWTAIPGPVDAADTAAVVKACRDQGGTIGVGPGSNISASELDVRLVERRGDTVAVLLTGMAPDRYEWSLSCMAVLPAAGGGAPTDVSTASSGGGGFAPPTGHQIFEGGSAQFGDDPGASFLGGRVGPEVAEVTIHADGLAIEATVEDGTFAAWWPGGVFDTSQVPVGGGEGGPTVAVTYDITLRDGTVLKDVVPTH